MTNPLTDNAPSYPDFLSAPADLTHYHGTGTAQIGLAASECLTNQRSLALPLPIVYGSAGNKEDEEQPSEPGPQLPKSVFTGLTAEYLALVGPCTEAPPEFHLGSFITAFGCLVGRNAWIVYPHREFPVFYTLLMGNTGISRKSTAYKFATDLLKDANDSLQGNAAKITSLSSVEGLALIMSRPLAGQPSTKILCALDEFKSFVTKNRQSATASIIPTVTELFNPGDTFENNTKNNPIVVKDPFFCMLAASTQAWFEESMSQSDVSGGFLNRWLVFGGQNGAPIPFPKPPDPAKRMELIKGVVAAVTAAKGEYQLATEAKPVFANFYSDFVDGRIKGIDPSSEVTSRVPLHAMKLGLLCALLAQHTQIEREDIEAGIAIAVHCARLIGPIGRSLGKMPRAVLQEKILTMLRSGPAISRDIQRKTRALVEDVNAILKALHDAGCIRKLGATKWELAGE